MPLPKPELGLVVNYAFVWASAGRHPPDDTGKSRPCLIVDLEDVDEAQTGGRLVKRVTYVPISHIAPQKGENAITIPTRVAVYLKLSEETSYLYTSYAVEDDWPFDLEKIPGSDDRFDYGLIPPKLFNAVVNDFKTYLQKRPQFVHRRGK
ncbi:MAG: hypothetical protein EXR11_07605 [Rhodospirillaceae bacterium]|nr:hypothetical protein [Rhodospirillaceae bacterium]